MARRIIPEAVRIHIAERAAWCCEYCKSQERFAPQRFTIDHIIPISKGGDDNLENLAYACQGCNGSKLDKIETRDPLTKQISPLFNPRIQIWEEHFAWDSDFAIVVGLTPIGRATVLALKLNRKQLTDSRKILAAFGEHPGGGKD